ncbi:hypothetical protein [Flavobacterium aestivum]|uniref:hypothetical protein n=1 Tax=Flavobacterium aestivum TaxID=3003257 RepID=UPI0024822C1A|nr:hypothetical protein [Flavobacterium aestivum]
MFFEIDLQNNYELNKDSYGKTWAIYYEEQNSIENITSTADTKLRCQFTTSNNSLGEQIVLKIKKIKNKTNTKETNVVGTLVLEGN